jgi:hypothetical protein
MVSVDGWSQSEVKNELKTGKSFIVGHDKEVCVPLTSLVQIPVVAPCATVFPKPLDSLDPETEPCILFGCLRKRGCCQYPTLPSFGGC